MTEIVPTTPAAIAPEARLARVLNLLGAGVLAAACIVSVIMVVAPMPPHPADYGEHRGAGLILLVFGVPFTALFWLAAEGFRRGARWRWVVQIIALSPIVVLVLVKLWGWLPSVAG